MPKRCALRGCSILVARSTAAMSTPTKFHCRKRFIHFSFTFCLLNLLSLRTELMMSLVSPKVIWLYTVSDLIDLFGRHLLRKQCLPEHPLLHLQPPHWKCNNVRDHGHPCELSEFSSNLFRSPFIVQALLC